MSKYCVVKNDLCHRRAAVCAEPLQVFAGFQFRPGGFIDKVVLEKFYSGLEQPLSGAAGLPVHIHIAKETLSSSNWCEICGEMQRSALCLFEISDNNPNVALEIGMAVAFGKRCGLLKKRNARNRIMTDINNFQLHVYEDLMDQIFYQKLIDFLVREITSNYWKPRQSEPRSKAKLISCLEKKRRLFMRRVLDEDEIYATHERLSSDIDANFSRRGMYGSRARITAQQRLDKNTALRLEKIDRFFAGQIDDIDAQIRDFTVYGLPVTDGSNTYLVVSGVKLKFPDDKSCERLDLRPGMPIADDLLTLLKTGEPLPSLRMTSSVNDAPSPQVYIVYDGHAYWETDVMPAKQLTDQKIRLVEEEELNRVLPGYDKNGK